MAAAYADLHEQVDRLTPEQADALRALVRYLVADNEQAPSTRRTGAEGMVRRLSFAGTLRSGRDDLAARSEEINRAGLGDAA